MKNKSKELINIYKNSDEKLVTYLKSLWIDLWNDYDINLLKRAFTHKSFSNDIHKWIESNERLEFLWDSILWFIISEFLYLEKDNMWEDVMSLYKIALVNEKMLAEVARDINAWQYIFLWLWEINSWWENKDSLLSDFIEALIAYIYLDLWEQEAREFIKKYIYSKFYDLKKNWRVKSSKSLLQEYTQNKYKIIPKYIDYEEEVDDKWNIILYKSEVYIWEKLLWVWLWQSKKKAQLSAAENALEKISNNKEIN